jgi:hypothetical protein
MQMKITSRKWKNIVLVWLIKNFLFEGPLKVKSYCNSMVTVGGHVAHTTDKKNTYTIWHGYVLHQGTASQGRALCKSQMTSRVLRHTAAAIRAHNVLQGTAADMRAHNVLQGTVE